MAQKDQIKWDRKYLDNPTLLQRTTPSAIIEKYIDIAPKGRALDIACGTGRNSIYLASRGYIVDALDISAVALQELTQHLEKITDISKVHTKLVDLDEYRLEQNQYELIVIVNFLDRGLISTLKEALKKGGIFIIETYMQDEDNEKQNSNPDYLLKSKELLDYFGIGFEVIEYREFWNDNSALHKMKKQSIVVKRVGDI